SHGLGGLPEEGAHGKSPKCLGGNLGDFGDFCKGLGILCFRRNIVIYLPAKISPLRQCGSNIVPLRCLLPHAGKKVYHFINTTNLRAYDERNC
ncbi:hypothetical protein, partial [Neisseria gonorrhoeae]|uniref:hypothetical protein n=6 Tax=Neisseria gonorrhoeae TaxID=485 RepID=UPI0019D4FF2A